MYFTEAKPSIKLNCRSVGSQKGLVRGTVVPDAAIAAQPLFYTGQVGRWYRTIIAPARRNLGKVCQTQAL